MTWAAVLKSTWLALVLVFATVAVRAGTPEDAMRVAMEQARAAARNGPVDIELNAEGVLHLPAQHVFVPQPQASALLQAMGNPGTDPRLLGMVFPAGDGNWFMTVRYEASGHVKDDDAKDWNADDLLESYKKGTEAANEERVKMGTAAIEVLGWAEKPQYEAATHRLRWAMSSRDKGAPAEAPQGVNYNTYALGREGYFSLNLVTALAELPTHKPAAQALLAALDFKPGRRYEDFDAKTDHMAEYGLAALVVGVAAKKLGLLAAGLALLAKFGKLIVLGLALLGGVFVKFFRRRKTSA